MLLMILLLVFVTRAVWQWWVFLILGLLHLLAIFHVTLALLSALVFALC